MCSPEQPGAETRVSGQFDFHEEATTGRIGCRNDLDDLAGKLDIAQRVNHHRGDLPNMDKADIVFVYRHFKSIAARVFNREDGHAGRGQRPRIGLFFRYYASKRRANARVSERSSSLS